MNTDFGSNRQMPTCKSYEICSRLSCSCQRALFESTFWPPFCAPFLVVLVVTTIDIQTYTRTSHTHTHSSARIHTYLQNKWKSKLPRLLLVINGHWFVRLWNSVHGANNKSIKHWASHNNNSMRDKDGNRNRSSKKHMHTRTHTHTQDGKNKKGREAVEETSKTVHKHKKNRTKQK